MTGYFLGVPDARQERSNPAPNVQSEDGVTIEILGSITEGMNGVGALYTNKKSLSLVVGGNLQHFAYLKIKPYELIESLKAHHMVAPLIKDGEPREYMAHWLPEDKLFLDRFQVDAKSHLKIHNPDVCTRDCRDQPCLFFCPAGVYSLEEDGKVNVAYEGCLECGSCRIGCPHLNIEWHFPRGGYGIRHKFG